MRGSGGKGVARVVVASSSVLHGSSSLTSRLYCGGLSDAAVAAPGRVSDALKYSDEGRVGLKVVHLKQWGSGVAGAGVEDE